MARCSCSTSSPGTAARPVAGSAQATGLLLAAVAIAAYACGGAAESRRGQRLDLTAALRTEVERVAPAAAPNGGDPPLAGVRSALDQGRPHLALERYAQGRVKLETGRWAAAWTQRGEATMARLEEDWRALGVTLRDELRPPADATAAGPQPALVRALAEIALPRVRGNYDASLEYGRSTEPAAGAYYLGEAVANRELLAFLRGLGDPGLGDPGFGDSGAPPGPPLRSLAGELDRLEGELLAAYRPPASVDRHPEFIAAGAALKEARELDAAGRRHGALLRYLQLAARSAPLVAAGSPPPERAALLARLDGLEATLADPTVDHTLGRAFAEGARADLDAHADGTRATVAESVVERVLPAYLAALGPAPPSPPRPVPEVTVTLLRWPYT